jgi:hypothetical protein
MECWTLRLADELQQEQSKEAMMFLSLLRVTKA